MARQRYIGEKAVEVVKIPEKLLGSLTLTILCNSFACQLSLTEIYIVVGIWFDRLYSRNLGLQFNVIGHHKILISITKL